MEEQSFIVPADMVAEAAAVVKLLKEAASAQGLEEQVYLLQPKSKGFGPGELATTVLYVGGGTLGWLTGKWLDTYLWPLVQQRIDGPSKRFVRWLDEVLPKGPTT